MKKIILAALALTLFGCAPSNKPSGIIKKTEVQSVTVVDGVNGNMLLTLSSEKNQKVYLEADEEWVRIRVVVKMGGLKKETKTLHYRAEALVKYATEE